MSNINLKPVRIPLIAMALVVGSIQLFSLMGYHYNLTESMPVGLYKEVETQPEVGSVVLFCPPVNKKYEFMLAGSCNNSEALYIKQVIAVPGDEVLVTNEGVFVNGNHIADSALSGRNDLPKAYGLYRLKDGEYWTFGSGQPQKSFDSRYFGVVKRDQLTVIAKV